MNNSFLHNSPQTALFTVDDDGTLSINLKNFLPCIISISKFSPGLELISLKLIVVIVMEGVFDTCSVMDKMIRQWYECSEGSYYTDISEIKFIKYSEDMK